MIRTRSRNSRNVLALQCGLALLAVITALTLAIKCGIHALWAYLLAVNFATFLAYAYDKWAAPRDGTRIPERTLHLATAAGGTPAAFAGQVLFRHKTRKPSFRIRFWSIVIVQAMLLAGWVWWSAHGHA